MTAPADRQVWTDAMAAFDAWSEQPAEARTEWLEALAAAQPTLHERLAALIRADGDAEHRAFLEPRVEAAAAPAAGLSGQHLGPWLVERLVGTGGMGQVWLARRTDGLYDGRAAIKLMRAAVADAAARAASQSVRASGGSSLQASNAAIASVQTCGSEGALISSARASATARTGRRVPCASRA